MLDVKFDINLVVKDASELQIVQIEVIWIILSALGINSEMEVNASFLNSEDNPDMKIFCISLCWRMVQANACSNKTFFK